tara:strand:+ start:266 stop:550 length:285 start_codon:yes stop_codon:yes gene_type:complete
MTSRFNPGLSVRYAQAKNRVSNRELAKHMGVAPIQVTRWRAAIDMRLSRLESLATFFGMTISEFLDLGLEATSVVQQMEQPVVSVSENQVVVNV